MTNFSNLVHVIAETCQMLDSIEPQGKFTFQTFAEGEHKTQGAKLLHGSIQDQYSRLLGLNNQGSGIFVTINQTDLQGRTANNIKRVRALWLDFDVESTTRINELLNLALPPTLIIESSLNKHHAYWVLSEGEIELEHFATLQKKLIINFDGADQAIHDLPRVMRLAGFYHLKHTPFMTNIKHIGKGYSSESLKQWVNSLPIQEKIKEQKQSQATKRDSVNAHLSTDSNPTNNITLSYEKTSLLARGRWIAILKQLNISITSIREHTACPICGGKDRFRFDDLGGNGTFICSQGDGNTIAGDGFELLKHSGMDATTALKQVNAVLVRMGLLNSYDQGKFKKPKSIQSELAQVEKLKGNMLPAILAQYIFKYAHNADKMTPDFCAVNLLVCLGSIIGAKVAIRPKQKDEYELISNLWGGVIAPPSSKKTHGISLATRFIDVLQKQEHKLTEHMSNEYEKQKMLTDSKTKALEAKLKNKVDDNEREKLIDEIFALKGQQTEKNCTKYLYLNDATPEALAEKQKNNPNGILVIRDELTGLFISLSKNDGDGRSYYLEGWNGTGSYQSSRIGRGDIFIENHCLSLLGGIQPTKLITYLEDSIKGHGNDGLLQRFQLLIYPDVQKAEYVDEYADQATYDKVLNIFEYLHALDKDQLLSLGALSDDGKRPYFRFNAEAQKAYEVWFNDFYGRLENETHEIIQEHLGKYVKLIGSLSLIFHLVKIAENKERIDLIEYESLSLALSWAVYLEGHAKRIYGMVLNLSSHRAMTIAGRLKKLKIDDEWMIQGFTARQVAHKGWKDLNTVEQVKDALEILTEAHWVIQQEVKSDIGRPSTRYLINPEIFKM